MRTAEILMSDRPTGHKAADLVAEALVREIGRAERWQSIEAAWVALIHTRHMADQMQAESENHWTDGMKGVEP